MYKNYNFEIGKGVQLTEGTDVTIIACGIMVQEALKAQKLLEEENIYARVIDMHTIKPIDREIIIGTENPVTEHRIIEVPEFDQDTATRCFLCEMFEHIAKDFFCLFFVGRKRLIQKFTFAIYYAMFH